ncbi:MAG: hypothetical protein J5I81_05805 [Nitrococcus mobilis]|nr:hypothetical protein [Nitrococcus mobilis]
MSARISAGGALAAAAEDLVETEVGDGIFPVGYESQQRMHGDVHNIFQGKGDTPLVGSGRGNAMPALLTVEDDERSDGGSLECRLRMLSSKHYNMIQISIVTG